MLIFWEMPNDLKRRRRVCNALHFLQADKDLFHLYIWHHEKQRAAQDFVVLRHVLVHVHLQFDLI